jgi:3-oxoacyl-[acyl-carrier protein] reductase
MQFPELTGRCAVVSGGTRGIGRAISIELAAQGCRVVALYRADSASADSLERDVSIADGNITSTQCDIRVHSQVMQAVQLAREKFGPIGILVNNAGIAIKSSLRNLDEQVWQSTMDTNLRSAMWLTQTCIPDMQREGWGRVLMVSSVASATGGGVGPHYAASKAGMEALALHCARSFLSDGITVNSIAPAAIDTEMTHALGGAAAAMPIGRLGTTAEVARLAVAMVGTAFLTGQTLHVNGGIFP